MTQTHLIGIKFLASGSLITVAVTFLFCCLSTCHRPVLQAPARGLLYRVSAYKKSYRPRGIVIAQDEGFNSIIHLDLDKALWSCTMLSNLDVSSCTRPTNRRWITDSVYEYSIYVYIQHDSTSQKCLLNEHDLNSKTSLWKFENSSESTPGTSDMEPKMTLGLKIDIIPRTLKCSDCSPL